MFKLTEGKTKGNMKHFDNDNVSCPVPPPMELNSLNNYYFTIFWSDLDMLKNFLESESYYGGFSDKGTLANYMLVGINNMIKQGYELKKKDDVKPIMEEIYKLRDKYVGKRFTMYKWVNLIKIIKKYI